MKKLRYAMVGGGRDAFIGAVHRKAMALDGEFEFVAGALSSSPEKSRASGQDLGLADDRNHADWQAPLADGARGVRFNEKTVESARSEQKWTRMD